MDLWDVLAGFQREEDDECEAFHAAHPELRHDPVYSHRTEFMNELFDSAECEWAYENTFRFLHPKFFVLDDRTLQILGNRGPDDMVWFGPHIEAVIVDSEPRIYIYVTTVDGDEQW